MMMESKEAWILYQYHFLSPTPLSEEGSCSSSSCGYLEDGEESFAEKDYEHYTRLLLVVSVFSHISSLVHSSPHSPSHSLSLSSWIVNIFDGIALIAVHALQGSTSRSAITVYSKLYSYQYIYVIWLLEVREHVLPTPSYSFLFLPSFLDLHSH